MSTTEIIRELCKKQGISVTSLEEKLGFGNGSISKPTANAMRSDRLLAIAKYFNVSMEFLMGESENQDENESYYLDEDTKDYAQFLFSNPEYRVLFDASKKVKKEDLQKALRAIGLFIDEE